MSDYTTTIMTYNVRILTGIAELTASWEQKREQLYRFACEQSGDSRWKDDSFRAHMCNEYIHTDTPITLRIYSLDQDNRETLIRYIDEKLMEGMSDRLFEV